MNLTDQEKAVLDFIIDYRAEHRCNPTHVKIAEIIPPIKREQLGRQSATAIIKSLKDKGCLIPTGRFGDYVVADEKVIENIIKETEIYRKKLEDDKIKREQEKRELKKKTKEQEFNLFIQQAREKYKGNIEGNSLYINLDNIPKWRKQGRERVRFLVRLRDNFTCQSCLRVWKEGERHFDVHHLNGVCGKKSRSYDTESDMEGMITLCHKCHFNHPEHSFKSGDN